MQKPCLYILCGLPFAGKTTLARELVHRLGIRRVAIDDINNERGIWDDEKGLSSKEWDKTYHEAYQRIATYLSGGESVVDDSTNCTKEQRSRLREIAEQYEASTCVIFVDTALAEVRRRWQENRQTGVRNDVRDDDFAHVVEYFTVPTEDENVLRYDGTMSAGEWVQYTFNKSRRSEKKHEKL